MRRLGDSVRYLGNLFRRRLARLLDLLLEWRYGIATSNEVGLETLGLAHPERVQYTPTGWLSLRRILPRSEVSGEDVFMDFGSGKGRAVLLAAQYPFKRVIGVEIARELHEIAQANLRRNARRLTCKNVELINGDVLNYDVPDDVTVAFFFNPFSGDIFRSVIREILASIDALPRTVRLIYVNPFEEESLLATGRARLTRRASALDPLVHMYELR